jgi:hypothetical protein
VPLKNNILSVTRKIIPKKANAIGPPTFSGVGIKTT